MGRRYTVTFEGEAESAQVDFFEIAAASGKPLTIHNIIITQETEAGDAQEEQLRVVIKGVSGSPTSGSSGATTVNKVPKNRSLAAAGFDAEACNTTKLSGGTAVVHHAETFNVRTGFVWRPVPEETIDVLASEYLVVELKTTPADSVTWNGTMEVEEHG